MGGLIGGKAGFGGLQAAVSVLNGGKAGFGGLQAAASVLNGGKSGIWRVASRCERTKWWKSEVRCATSRYFIGYSANG
ncbi:hypothetical protein [Cohnella abietis]|uniref:Uncharacterized protein n=1 Tax=Cohnella abietis TaxID=2507935 RepID=A0A3T1D9V9_9BACL|nr:hypothetical protein [Cohnella abietis]BBI34853.1 hypothetical protein KCTCHS21_42520 [Cohnella abietis]